MSEICVPRGKIKLFETRADLPRFVGFVYIHQIRRLQLQYRNPPPHAPGVRMSAVTQNSGKLKQKLKIEVREFGTKV